MTPNRWQQIEEIFQAALDLSPEERRNFINQECASDTDLKEEVEKLLADFDSAEDFIESPVWTNSDFLNSAAKNEIENSLDKKLQPRTRNRSMPGRRIGAYELKEEIGRGGMGAVYLAERADGEFRQKVAIKLIKRGMDTDFVLSRFRRERQILANLNHTNIVLLLDGGTTNDGLPYFVMDFVEGEPIHKYCSQNNLSLVARLELFRQVCEAIDYAHRKKVVHRDLKPSNILVNKYGIPKLLDFGIAKLLDPEQEGDTLAPTETHMRLMTPEYASPEQVSGLPITPVSDIYSLGVLLYLLVTGKRPYKFPTRAPHEVARVICEANPVKPSEAVKEHSNEGDALQISIPGRNQLTDDIDKIILKALRKDPAERYQTAAELSEDILRYLENRPVKAQSFSPVASREIKKTVKEPKSSGEQSIAILPFKIFGLPDSEAAETINTGDSGDEFLSLGLADSLITRLSNVRRLIVRPTSSVLPFSGSDVDPFSAGRELGVNFVLDGSIRRAGNRFRVSVQLLNTADDSTRWAQKFDEDTADVIELEDSISEKVVTSLIPYLTGEERQKLGKRGTHKPEAYEAYLRGRFFWNKFTADALPKALRSFQKAIELDPDYALAYVGMADFYTWANIYGIIPASQSRPLAEQAARRAIELDESLGEAYAALGLVNSNVWNWAECEQLYKQSLELNPNYPNVHEWYSALLVGTGRTEEGIREIQRAEQLDPLSLRTMTLVAWTSYQARLFDEALEKAEQIIELDKNYPQGYLQLGNILIELGEFDRAAAEIQKCVQLMPDSQLPIYSLCFALAGADRLDEAKALTEEMRKAAKSTYVKPYFLAMSYAAIGEIETAFEYFEKAFAERDAWLLWFGTEAKLDFLRDDPRFIRLFRRTENPLAESTAVSVKSVSSSDNSIAVLPLKMLGEFPSNDSGEEFLGVGLTDSLIMRLSQLRRFTVRPTSSVLRFHEKQINPFEAGAELGVRYILDGNIRRSANRLRVTLQLLDANQKSTVWAKQFNGTPSDIFALEDSISEQVAKNILPQFSTDEQKQLAKRGTNNAEAYEAYLRGRIHWNKFSLEGFSRAFAFYQRAVEIAPDYALAYTGLADYYNFLGVYTVQPFSVTATAAKEYALRAVSLDPTLSEAYAALGFAVLMRDFDWDETEKHFRRALELNPNYVLARVWYCYFLGMQKRFDEAFEQIDYALKLDSITPLVPQTLNWTYYYARRFQESIDATRSLISREPNYGLSHVFLSQALSTVGEYDDAIITGQKAVELIGKSPYTLTWLASTYAAANRREETFSLLAEIKEMSKNRYVSPYLLGMVYSSLGDKERALKQLATAMAIRDARLMWLAVDPKFDSLRDDSRVQSLLRETGNPAVV